MITGFAGKIHLDGSLATNEEVLSLRNCLTLQKDYHVKTKLLGSLAVVSAAPAQNDSAGEEIILSDHESYLMTGSGSLYNKEELSAILGVSGTLTDLELMWRGWLSLGSPVVKYLSGDWMFAAYNKDRDELLLARSWGLSSLYFYQGKDFIAFATQPAILSAMPGVPHEPDLRTITQVLCALPVPPEATVWKGIRQLQPASTMLITRGSIKEEIWWRPSYISKIMIKDERDALEQFLFLYRKAIKNRISSVHKVGATLSSGLDSTSVCSLAAQELQSSEMDLQVWTSVPHYAKEASSFGSWLADERVLATDFAKGVPNIKHTLVEAEGSDPINAIRVQLLRTGKPQSSVANLYWIDKILLSAAQADCQVMLTGQFGNSTVSYSPLHIPLVPKQKYFPETSLRNYLGIIKRKMLKNIGNVRQTAADHIFRRDNNYPVINPGYLRSRDFKHDTNIYRSIKKITQADLNEIHMSSFDLWYHNSFWYGVEVRDPTMDIELTEFMLSLPDNMFFRDSMDRRMLRLGLKGLMPDAIRLNKHRGQQASDIVPRVRNFSQPAVNALSIIESSGLAKGLLNTQKMNTILSNIVQGETGLRSFQECSRILLPGLSIGLFLASFDTDYDLNTPLG